MKNHCVSPTISNRFDICGSQIVGINMGEISGVGWVCTPNNFPIIIIIDITFVYNGAVV